MHEAAHQPGQAEVQAAQTEHRERVRGPHDEGAGGDGQHGRHRIDGEDQVGGLHRHQDHEQQGGDPGAVSTGEETAVVVLADGGDHAADHAHQQVSLGVHILVVLEGHLVGGVDQERSEHVCRPEERLQQFCADEDEDQPEQQRTDDTPEQHLVLIAVRDGEVGEDQREDEHVVHRQRLLDEISRVVGAGDVTAVGPPHDHTEPQSGGDPDGRPDRGLCELHHMVVAVQEQVDGEHGHDRDRERDPCPQWHHQLNVSHIHPYV